MKNTSAGAILNVTALDDVTDYDFSPSDSYVALSSIPAGGIGTTLTLPFDASDGDTFAFADVDGSCGSLSLIEVLVSNSEHTLFANDDGAAWVVPFSAAMLVFSEVSQAWLAIGTLSVSQTGGSPPWSTNAAAVPLSGTAKTILTTVSFTPATSGVLLVRMGGSVEGDGTASSFVPGIAHNGGANDFSGALVSVPATASFGAAFFCEALYGGSVGALDPFPVTHPGTPVTIDATGTAGTGGALTVEIQGVQLTVTEISY